MFHNASRYADLEPYTVVDRRGRLVLVVPAARAPADARLGAHLRTQGQRPDHIAARYLGDATATWRLAELADAMHMDAIAQAAEIAIPGRR